MDRIKVIRGSKIVRVTENELDKYLSKGYVIKGGEKLSSEPTQPTPKKYENTPKPLYQEEPKIVEPVKKTQQTKRSQRKGNKK